MDRRAFLERLAAVAAVASAGCANLSGNGSNETTAETRTATAAGTRTGTASEKPTTEKPTTTDDGPPDIPAPGTPPTATTTAGRTTTEGGPPDIPPPGTPPSAVTTEKTTDDGPPDIPAPGTPPVPTRTTGISCSLSHRVVDSGDDLTPSSVSVIQYADLSTAAKRIVGRAIESNETVSIPYDSRQRPPEFAYSDESHVYDIEYRGTTYRLFTATGMGCPVITATE